MLEEVGPEYEVVQVDIEAGDQLRRIFSGSAQTIRCPL
jgi:hypothetical protein